MLSAISATKSASWLAVTTSSISRLSDGVTGTHDSVRSLDAVVDVYEGTSLLTSTPDLDLAAIETRATLRPFAHQVLHVVVSNKAARSGHWYAFVYASPSI